MLGARTARIAQRDRLRERTRCWHGFRVGWQPWSAASAARAAQVLEAQLPQRTSRMRRAPRAVHPYLCLAVRAGGGPGGAATGGQTARTSAKRAETRPVWRETFHLCIGDASPVLEIVAMHAGSAAGARPAAPPPPPPPPPPPGPAWPATKLGAAAESPTCIPSEEVMCMRAVRRRGGDPTAGA